MPLRIDGRRLDRLKAAGVALAAIGICVALRKPLARVGALALGAGLLCLVTAPLASLLERRLPRPVAALVSLIAIGLAVGALAWLLLPAMLRQLFELANALPYSLRQVLEWAESLQAWAETSLPGIRLPSIDPVSLEGALAGIAGGTLNLAVNVADLTGRLSLTVMLAYFALCDRDRLVLRLELLLPAAHRPTAIQMGNAVCREWMLYLRAQVAVAVAVGSLSAAALALVGVRGALALGPVIGIFNIIPYFGPFIGSVPAVLVALGDGWQRAAMAVIALTVVQQLDGAWISPRIMGSLTGFSPALVLVGIYAGASVGGIAGMLLALPAMMTIRTLFRIFVQKCENI